MVAGISEVQPVRNFFMSSDKIRWGVVPKGMNFDIFSEDLTASVCSDFTQDYSDGT